MNKQIQPVHEVAIETAQLRDFTVQCMSAVGASETDAHYMAHQLLAAEIGGHASHGLRKLPEYIDRALEGNVNPAATATIEKDTGALLAMNGNRTHGHFALRDATALAVQRAKLHGISAVSVRDSDFAGRFAPFCEEAAEAGVVTLIFGNNNGSLQSVLPPGGTQPRLSTNPIAAGVPRARAPHMVIDFATSQVASSRLHFDREAGAQTPEGWVSEDGHLKPFGGVKGFGLALLVEALGGALSGSDTVSARESKQAQGTLIIALDVSQMRDLRDYAAQVEEFIAHVKNTEPESGASPVRAPGENSPTAEQLAAVKSISIRESTVQNLNRTAQKLGIAAPRTQ